MTAPTPATQTTLADWLLERLDEDEAAARAAGAGRWNSEWGGDIVAGYGSPIDGEVIGSMVDRASAEQVARHDPARVLADVAARRAIVELHTVLPVRSLPGGRLADGCCTQCTAWGEYGGPTPDGEPNPCDTLRLLAAPYASHPGYDERWAVR